MKAAAATQTAIVGIDDIDSGIVRLTCGHYRAVLEVNSVNFKLLSETEQEGVIASYRGCLNSLAFPIQIVVRVVPVDVELYVSDIEQRLRSELSVRLLELGRDHLAYVRRSARTRMMLDRRFLVVVPADNGTSVRRGWTTLGRRGQQVELDAEAARTQLTYRTEEMERQLNRCGLSARRLSTNELADLYLTCWCPDSGQRQRRKQNVSEFTALVVQAPGPEEETICRS